MTQANCARVSPDSTLLFLAGLEALDEGTKEVIGLGDVEAQARRIMERMRDELESVQADLSHLVLLHVYLIHNEDRAKVQRILEGLFTTLPPTHFCKVENLAIPGMLIEIEGTVTIPFFPGGQGKTMGRETIKPEKLCPPVGPFSYGCIVRPGSTLLYLSGINALDEKGEVVAKGDMRGQIERGIENLRKALDASGSNLKNLVHLRIYTLNIPEFRPTGPWRAQRFPELWSSNQTGCATTLLEVRALAHPDLLVEFEAVALI